MGFSLGLAHHSDCAEQRCEDKVDKKQNCSQDKGRNDNDFRRADHFLLARPRDFFHFPFGRDQEVGEFRPIDDPEKKAAHADQDNHRDTELHAYFHTGQFSGQSVASPCAEDQQYRHGARPGVSSLVSFVDMKCTHYVSLSFSHSDTAGRS
jgi:hypothetical protein